jgi:hypothetical protein
MTRAIKLVLALAVAAAFSTGGFIMPVQKAEAGSCIWRYGHQYCLSEYWKGDCFYYDYDIYCRYYPPKKKKKYYYNGGGGSGY